MTGAESFVLRRLLAAHGWALRVFPYSSLAEPMQRVAGRCARHAAQLAARTQLPVHLLGHSLGGLVIYRAFETGLLDAQQFNADTCRVVFMGSPVCGSQCARVLAGSPAARLLGTAGARDLQQGLPAQWPFAARLGIIAGNAPYGLGRLLTRLDGPNDGAVAVSETRIEGAADQCVLPVSHTGMLLSAQVARQVDAFLGQGRFNR